MAKNSKKATIDVSLRDDPRVRDVVVWNTFRIMVDEDAIDPAWRCPLYRLHKVGFINSDLREAGDKYHGVVLKHNEQQMIDPDDHPGDDLVMRRIKKAKYNWENAIDVLGYGRAVVDALVLREEHLTEREKYVARDALQLYANYLRLGNKPSTRMCYNRRGAL